MPRQEKQKQVEVKLDKVIVDDTTYDVLYIDGKEIVAFHLDNIEKLNLVHTPDTMIELIQNYFNGS